ncbi:MAG: ABC transporter permease [Candidatus Bipolaricaulia bacterium]
MIDRLRVRVRVRRRRTPTPPSPELEPELEEPVRRGESTWKLVWRRFRRHRLAILGATVIVTLVLLAILAPWLTPYDFSRQNRRLSFSGPSLNVIESPRALDKCVRSRVLLWRCGIHPFGTDDLGRDILTRVLHGGRVSLLVGFVAALISTFIGSLLGATAAYMGGRLDSVISRFTDTMLSIPQLPLLLILSGLLASSQGNFTTYLNKVLGGSKSIAIIIFVIIILSWMSTTRLVRGEVLSLREREFVDAARALGGSSFRVLFRHLLPNATHVIIVQATLQTGEAILVESGLSFLGLGIQPPAVSWGNMLSRAQEFFFYPNGIFIALFPGLLIFLTVLCFNFLGDGLRDALDPRWKR